MSTPPHTMAPTTARDAERAARIDAALIERVVRTFYARIREDDLLGPVFASRIDDWEPHLQRMMAFWGSVMHIGPSRYEGQPMQKHQPLPIDATHFDHWLALFEATVHDVCPPDSARLFIDRSQRIARSLELGLALSQGELLTWGERYHRPRVTAP